MLKKSLFKIYIGFFILLFTILFSLNFLIKKYVVNFQVDHKYLISGQQIYDYKSRALNYILYQITNTNSEQVKIRIENMNILKSDIILIELKYEDPTIQFFLYSNKFFDEKELEKQYNNYYSVLLNKNIENLKKISQIFDFEILQYKYEKNINKKIIFSYDLLVSSDFHKKYSMFNCNNDDKKSCLKTYSSYYRLIYENLLNFQELEGNDTIIKRIIEKNKITYQELVEDLISGPELYENISIYENVYKNYTFKDFFLDEYSNNVKINLNNILSLVYGQSEKNKCDKDLIFLPADDFKECIKITKKLLFKKIKEHELELKKPFRVNYQRINYYFLNDVLITLTISLVITYFFFSITKKFFRRKIK
jgi:hypothetical protein